MSAARNTSLFAAALAVTTAAVAVDHIKHPLPPRAAPAAISQPVSGAAPCSAGAPVAIASPCSAGAALAAPPPPPTPLPAAEQAPSLAPSPPPPAPMPAGSGEAPDLVGD